MRNTLVSLIVLSLFGPLACLDPLVDDEVVRRGAMLPAGTEVPPITEDPLAFARLDANDFVDGDVVPILSGFMGGERVWYWDFGEAPLFPQPLYLLVEEDPDGPMAAGDRSYSPIGHPPVWNVIPGDPAYSPFWLVVLLPVTEAYSDEVLSSFDAVEDARAAGLVDEPIETPMVVNCPVVVPGTTLEDKGGEERPTSPAYYRGYIVDYFDVGVVDLDTYGNVPVGSMYVLRREGSEPLDEATRGVDITGDGDLNDSNNIFQQPGSSTTHLFQVVDVVVPAAYESIDTNGDETLAEYTDDADIIDANGQARGDHIVAAYQEERICNCPVAP